MVDFKFTPDSRYCASCYARYAGRYDELNPKAVSEQQNPPGISRPIEKGDMPD